MNQAAGAIITPEKSLTPAPPVSSRRDYGVVGSGISGSGSADVEMPGGDLNAAWTNIVQSVTSRSGGMITVDLAEGESVREFSTRLRMLLLFMNRESGSVSATVSPSFKNDTYPAMLDLVNAFQRSGAGDEWRPDGPRSVKVGKASHLFVSVDMPVAGRSSSPDTMLEIVEAHRIDAAWYDQRVRPRASSLGLTVVMFGVPDSPASVSPGTLHGSSIFQRERARNLSGRPGGIHFSRQQNWPATTAV